MKYFGIIPILLAACSCQGSIKLKNSCELGIFSLNSTNVASIGNSCNIKPVVTLPKKDVFKYTLSGMAVNSGKRLWMPESVVKTTVEHFFSPHLESKIKREIMVSESDRDARERELHILSPGIVSLPDGRYLTMLRLWFRGNEQFNMALENRYLENYIYQQYLTENFKRAESGMLLPLLPPIQFTEGGGPSDPRLFTIGNSVYVSFYMIRDTKNIIGRMFIWDVAKRRLFHPKVAGLKLSSVESNWSPFEFKGKLHYIHLYNPLQVIFCDFPNKKLESSAIPCRLIIENSPGSLAYEDTKDVPLVAQIAYSNELLLRGGTPLVAYYRSTKLRPSLSSSGLSTIATEEHLYYLTAVHSTFVIAENFRQYHSHFVLLRGKARVDHPHQLGSMCIVFVSQSIGVNPSVWNASKLILPELISDPFIFPVGLVVQNGRDISKPADCVLLSYHASDDKSFISRFCGLTALLKPLLSTKSSCLSDVLSPEELNIYIRRILV